MVGAPIFQNEDDSGDAQSSDCKMTENLGSVQNCFHDGFTSSQVRFTSGLSVRPNR